MDNSITTWQQGEFIDGHAYKGMPDSWKHEMREREKILVRPSPMGNHIAVATTPELAAWVAERLNLAAKLEVQAREMRREIEYLEGLALS